jgi:hypothetical protein
VEKLRDPSHARLLAPHEWIGLCADAGLRVARHWLRKKKQPDLEWYFETAATSPDNRAPSWTSLPPHQPRLAPLLPSRRGRPDRLGVADALAHRPARRVGRSSPSGLPPYSVNWRKILSCRR